MLGLRGIIVHKKFGGCKCLLDLVSLHKAQAYQTQVNISPLNFFFGLTCNNNPQKLGAANVALDLVSSDFGKDWVNPHCKVSLTREGVPRLAVYIELWSLNIDQVDIALAG